MKHLLLFLAFLLYFSVRFQDYKAQWEKVFELETKGLVKPANEEVSKIYILAKKDKNEPQQCTQNSFYK